MKLKILILSLMLSLTSAIYASDCEMYIQVLPVEGVSSEISDLICSRLQNALTADGSVASGDYGQFYVVARCNDLYKETLATAPLQVAVSTELTLGIAEIETGTIFTSKTFSLKGVGSTEQRAYINALKGISGSNNLLKSFINTGKEATIKYFDKNYKTFLAKAKRAASMQDYGQALYYSTLIPSCCIGYDDAESAVSSYYQAYLDEEGEKNLNEAKAAFAVSPNADGAEKAYSYLSQINVRSKAYDRALNFADKIKAQTKVEYDFEVHQKYADNRDLRNSLIDAARQVGVAYGQGQKSTSTNILWK